MKNDLIYLITVSRRQNRNGFYSEKCVRREVFADVKTIKRAEHYSAERAGKKVQLTAVVNDDDYQMAVIDEGEDVSQQYEAETIHLDGSKERETIVPHIKKEPEYVEINAVRYRIERNFKDPKSVDRELTVSQVE